MPKRDTLSPDPKLEEHDTGSSTEDEKECVIEGLTFRFSLKHLFIVITALCLFFAILAALSFRAQIYLLFAVFLLASHFIGAVIGNKLGQKADKQLAEKETRE